MTERATPLTSGFEKKDLLLGTDLAPELYYVNHFDLLPEETKKLLTTQSKTLVITSFGQKETDPGFEDDVIEFLRNGELYIIIRDKKLIGIKHAQALTYDNHSILYLGGAAFSPEAQGNGLNSRLTSHLISSYSADLLTARTQNPNIYKMFERMCNVVWPQPENPTPPHIQEVGLFMIQSLNRTPESFNAVTLVDRKTYGTTLYDTIPHPQSSSWRINEFFNTQLDFAQGDSMIIIGEISRS